jgi:hypothetical protein
MWLSSLVVMRSIDAVYIRAVYFFRLRPKVRLDMFESRVQSLSPILWYIGNLDKETQAAKIILEHKIAQQLFLMNALFIQNGRLYNVQ